MVASRRPVLEVISSKIIVVSDRPGMGIRAKAALQSCFGSYFAAVFECQMLAAKAGVDGRVMHEVLTNSGLASPSLNYCATQVLNRKFVDTGSTMVTIYKDIGVSLDFAQVAMSAFPGENNWAAVNVLEQITGVQVAEGESE